MAGRQFTPIRRNHFVASAAILLLATWHTGLVFAAVTAPEKCDDASKPSFEISDSQLEAINVSHEIDANGADIVKSNSGADTLSPTPYVSPGTEAALREVFEQTNRPVADSPVVETSLADDDEPPSIKTRVPGVSDDDLARYKRHMFRRDI